MSVRTSTRAPKIEQTYIADIYDKLKQYYCIDQHAFFFFFFLFLFFFYAWTIFLKTQIIKCFILFWWSHASLVFSFLQKTKQRDLWEIVFLSERRDSKFWTCWGGGVTIHHLSLRRRSYVCRGIFNRCILGCVWLWFENMILKINILNFCELKIGVLFCFNNYNQTDPLASWLVFHWF